MKKIVLLYLLLVFSTCILAQADTCNCQKNKPTVVPLILIGVGSINYLDGTLDNNFRDWRNKNYPEFRTHIDDYIWYVPAIATFGLQLAGVKGKHDIKAVTNISAISLVAITGIVHGLKNTVLRERPDASSRVSFPSGHTASAFWAATVAHKEYGKKYPWISVASYSVASATGVMRMMNNKHWFSDVCVGAGIGILATELTYRIYDKQVAKRRAKGFKPLW